MSHLHFIYVSVQTLEAFALVSTHNLRIICGVFQHFPQPIKEQNTGFQAVLVLWFGFWSFPQKSRFAVVLGVCFVGCSGWQELEQVFMMCSLELRPFCTIPVQVYIRGFNSYAPLICICSILNSSILNCSFPYILSDLPQRKLISKEFQIIFSVLNNLAFAATEYHFTLMDALKYLNTVFAHYFIVFMGKIKLMISRSDATAWYRNLENRN